jgi:hypothetical protein
MSVASWFQILNFNFFRGLQNGCPLHFNLAILLKCFIGYWQPSEKGVSWHRQSSGEFTRLYWKHWKKPNISLRVVNTVSSKLVLEAFEYSAEQFCDSNEELKIEHEHVIDD